MKVNNFFSKITNKPYFTLFEPILLFSVLFLPGYISQNIQEPDFSIFNSAYFNFYYITTTLPHFILILYIIKLKPNTNLNDYNISEFNFSDLPKAGIVFIGIFLCFFIIGSISTIFEPKLDNSLVYGSKWEFSSPALLPLIFISSIITGYNEEIFFRSYLYTSLRKIGTPIITTVISTSILFGAGHIYEGYFAFAATTIVAILLSVCFIKTKSIHAISIGHGLYNFSVLFLAMKEVFL